MCMLSPLKKYIYNHFISKCVSVFRSFLGKPTVDTCESGVLPLCLSFLVAFRVSLLALCKGLGVAAAVEQMCQRVFCAPGTDDSKTLWEMIKKFVIPIVMSVPS